MLSRIVRFSEPRVQRMALALLVIVLLVARAAYSLHLSDRLRFGDETGYSGNVHNKIFNGFRYQNARKTSPFMGEMNSYGGDE